MTTTPCQIAADATIRALYARRLAAFELRIAEIAYPHGAEALETARAKYENACLAVCAAFAAERAAR